MDTTERLHFPVHFHALEKEMATHFSVLAWKIPGTGEPGRLQSMGWLRVGHNWATSLSLFTFMHWRRKGQPTPVFLENPRDGGAWWAAVYGVTQSQTWLKRLSSSSSRECYLYCFYFLKCTEIFFLLVCPQFLWLSHGHLNRGNNLFIFRVQCNIYNQVSLNNCEN